MGSPGDHEDVPHTLLPLTLAVGLVRNKAYADRSLTNQGREGDFNMLAGFIASTVLVYEYSLDPSKPPRPLRAPELEGGFFRAGAKELQFIDGRPTLHHLAVNATDLESVVAVLLHPQRAAQIRSGYIRKRAQKLRERSRRLQQHAAELRRDATSRREPAASATDREYPLVG
jgi:hypothetical protein